MRLHSEANIIYSLCILEFVINCYSNTITHVQYRIMYWPSICIFCLCLSVFSLRQWYILKVICFDSCLDDAIDTHKEIINICEGGGMKSSNLKQFDVRELVSFVSTAVWSDVAYTSLLWWIGDTAISTFSKFPIE